MFQWLIKKEALPGECEWDWTAKMDEAYLFATYDDTLSFDDATKTVATLKTRFGWHCTPYCVGESDKSGARLREASAAQNALASAQEAGIAPARSVKPVARAAMRPPPRSRRRTTVEEYQRMLEKEHLE